MAGMRCTTSSVHVIYFSGDNVFVALVIFSLAIVSTACGHGTTIEISVFRFLCYPSILMYLCILVLFCVFTLVYKINKITIVIIWYISGVCFNLPKELLELAKWDIICFRAFIAWEDHVMVDMDKEHKLRANLKDYKNKLRVGDNILPDPFTLEDGWFGEAEQQQWPSLYINDIADYLKEKSPKELYKKINEWVQAG